MRSLLTRIFFKNKTPKQFLGTQIPKDRIDERVFLKNCKKRIDITQRHGIACQTPFHLAVWFRKDEGDLSGANDHEVEIVKGEKRLSWLKLSAVHRIELDDGIIVLYRIEKSKCYQLSSIHQYVLLKYYYRKNNTTYQEREIYGALYTYPRNIIVVSYREDGYFNIFPMDFQCYVPEANIYMLGLRTTNITLDKMINTKKVVISDTGSADFKTIYSLGAHHSSAPPNVEQLPFAVSESEKFRFPIPGFSSSYKEVELLGNYKLGSHMFLYGKVVNDKKIKNEVAPMQHVHFFEFQNSQYVEI